MTYFAAAAPSGTINLQATLSAASSGLGGLVKPHHPLTCASALALEEDNTLACEHAQAPPGDRRTQACIDHSVAILLIELLRQKEEGDAPRR